MGNWGHDSFLRTAPSTSLESAVWHLPPKLKQAMFAAASRQVIKRANWNGCAFNAAGAEINESVSSYESAARAFNVPTAVVENFINTWDTEKGSDEECTARLLLALKKADLWREAYTKPPRIWNVKVYENQQSVLHRQFEELMQFNAIPDEDIALDLLVGSALS